MTIHAGSSFKEIEMNEMVMQYVREYGMAALTSVLATFGGCLASGGCAKIKSIGIAAHPPIVEVDAFGVKVFIRSVRVDFYGEDGIDWDPKAWVRPPGSSRPMPKE